MKITKDTTLEDILNYHNMEKILEKFNIPCIHCPMAKYEMGRLKLKEISKAYNIDIKALLKELNKVLEKKEKE